MLDEEGNNAMSIHFRDGKNDKHVNQNPSGKGVFLRGFLIKRRNGQ